MDNENNVIKEAPKGSYITGIVGAIIGAVIATVPWIIVYMEMNYILSLLAVLIGFGALKGYELCKGKMTKIVKLIVMVIAIIVIFVANCYVIPTIYANKNNVDIQKFYDSDEYMSALTSDLIISIIFVIAGVTAVFPSIDRKLEELGISTEKTNKNVVVGPAYTDNSAEKNIINESIKNETESSKELKKRKSNAVIVFITIILIIGACVYGFSYSNKNTKNNSINSSQKVVNEAKKEFVIQDGKFSLNLTDNWKETDSGKEGVTYLDRTDKVSSITITVTSKEELKSIEGMENVTFEQYGEMLEEYVYSLYKPEEEKHIEKSKVGNYDAQKIEITTLYSGSKFIVTAYCFETENDYIEFYEITLKSRFDKYKSQLEEAVKSFKEL